MYQVYRLNCFPDQNNRYRINCDESWSIARDNSFSSKEDAEEYIIEKSRLNIHLPLFLHFCSNKDKFSREFCFTDDTYLKYRRYFLNEVPIKELREASEKDGIKVILNSV